MPCTAAFIPILSGGTKSGDTSGKNGNGGDGGRSGNANNFNSNFNKVFGIAGRKLLDANSGGQSNGQVHCSIPG